MSIPFSNTTDKNGILQLCEFNCGLGDGGITGDATLLRYFTAFVNQSLSEVWSIVFRNSNGWIYDDSNQTDLPQGTQTLTSGTSKYALPSGALTVRRVEVKDSSGMYYELRPKQLESIKVGVDEYFETDGTPIEYRLVGSTLEMFPGPNYTASAGLKVYFDRGSVAFATSDTTKTPGFSPEFHDIIPTKASIKWMRINKPNGASLVKLQENEIQRVSDLADFEASKWKHNQPGRIQTAITSSR